MEKDSRKDNSDKIDKNNYIYPKIYFDFFHSAILPYFF